MSDLLYPFRSALQRVEEGWIDYNGHLNMAYYNVLFDRALDEAALNIGLGPDYLKDHQASYYTAEAHIRYLREIHAGDGIYCLTRLIDADEKRLHWWQELWLADGKSLSATSEQISLHVDMRAKKVVSFPLAIATLIARFRASDDALPRPEATGRRIALKQG